MILCKKYTYMEFLYSYIFIHRNDHKRLFFRDVKKKQEKVTKSALKVSQNS